MTTQKQRDETVLELTAFIVGRFPALTETVAKRIAKITIGACHGYELDALTDALTEARNESPEAI